MIVLSWNCKGLENTWIIHDLCLLTQEKKPNIIFLIETKLDAIKMELVRHRIGFEGCLMVSALGRKGGLAMLWCTEEQVEVWNYSQNHISV